MPKGRNKDTTADWTRKAETTLARLVRKARRSREIAALGPKPKWVIELKLVSAPVMTRLNARYRKKRYATDVLSFPTPQFFRDQGHLGELVICLPVLKRQAKEQGHSESQELAVLTAHGLIHLLGLDHEKSRREAARMEKLEALLLGRSAGLIRRSS